MADDYDPITGTSGGAGGNAPTKLQSKMTSQMSLKKTKTVVFPIKASLAEKKKKLIQYGTINDKEEGKIIDDEKDENATIEWKTVEKLMEYYGHWYQFLILVVIQGALTYLRHL